MNNNENDKSHTPPQRPRPVRRVPNQNRAIGAEQKKTENVSENRSGYLRQPNQINPTGLSGKISGVPANNNLSGQLHIKSTEQTQQKSPGQTSGQILSGQPLQGTAGSPQINPNQNNSAAGQGITQKSGNPSPRLKPARKIPNPNTGAENRQVQPPDTRLFEMQTQNRQLSPQSKDISRQYPQQKQETASSQSVPKQNPVQRQEQGQGQIQGQNQGQSVQRPTSPQNFSKQENRQAQSRPHPMRSPELKPREDKFQQQNKSVTQNLETRVIDRITKSNPPQKQQPQQQQQQQQQQNIPRYQQILQQQQQRQTQPQQQMNMGKQNQQQQQMRQVQRTQTTQSLNSQIKQPAFQQKPPLNSQQNHPLTSQQKLQQPQKNNTPNNETETKVIPAVNINRQVPSKKSPYMQTPPSAGNNMPQKRTYGTVTAHSGSNSSSAKKTYQSKKSRKQYNEAEENEATGALNSVLKAVMYIMFVLVVSGFMSYFGIAVVNDVFAFIKSDEEIPIQIAEYSSLKDISKVLKEAGVIKYPSMFRLYASLRRDDEKYVSGNYIVSPSMTYDKLLLEFKEKTPPLETITITIPEGYSVDEIINLFVSKGMGTKEKFIEVIQNEDFSDYWFIKELDGKMSPDRKYRLEGYLFPDTYFYFTTSSEKTIINKMLANFDTKFEEIYRERCEELNFTVDEVVTLASMIQMEAKYPNEFAVISSVFHNRLTNPGDTLGLLQSDPTIQYILPEHKSLLTRDDTDIDNPYNTYKYKGLPPSAIGNPGLNALLYAMYPEDTDFYYFVADNKGYHLFAETYDEHIQNRLKIG